MQSPQEALVLLIFNQKKTKKTNKQCMCMFKLNIYDKFNYIHINNGGKKKIKKIKATTTTQHVPKFWHIDTH